jgi:hypothetical protein
MKRLLAALTLSILFMFGMQWVSVSPGYARAQSGDSFLPSINSSRENMDASNQPAFKVDNPNTLPSSRVIGPSVGLLAPTNPHEVAIKLVGSNQIRLSQPISLSGVLTDLATQQGIPDKNIDFYTYGVLVGQARTSTNGAYKIQINKNLPAGNYKVTASFKGAHLLAPATSDITFEVLPATVKVETVPAVAGITFQMDGQQFISGPDGTASVNIDKAGQYRLSVLLNQYKNPSQQVEFGRWTEESYSPYKDVVVPNTSLVQVGLNLYHKINLKFLDLEGFPVDPSRITEITIRSVQGDVFTLKPGDTPWLPASRTARRQIGLQETDLLYSINSVMIDGSNVVNSAQQRFYAKLDDSWSISVLLYAMHITARDALFASPTGNSVEVISPDGQSMYYPLDQSGKLDIHALARGIYHINLVGSNGMGTSTPVVLSRNQVVNLNVVTRMDMVVVGLLGISVAVGLVIYGRPWLVGFLFRGKRYSSHQMGKDFGS